MLQLHIDFINYIKTITPCNTDLFLDIISYFLITYIAKI